MDYLQVLHRYTNNLHIDTVDADVIHDANHDFTDILREMYTGGDAPTKGITYNITQTQDLVQDFSSTTLINGLTLVNLPYDTVNKNGVKITGSIGSTVIASMQLTGLESVNQITLSKLITADFYPISTLANINTRVLDAQGGILFEENDSMLPSDPAGGIPDTVIIPNIKGYDLTLLITITAIMGGTSGIPPVVADGYTSITFTKLDVQIDFNKILLPSDYIAPLQVVMRNADKVMMAISEITQQRYFNWTPRNTTTEDPNYIPLDASTIKKVYETAENLDYDYSIGYLFDVQPEGAYLKFKSTFTGTIYLLYSYLPSLNYPENGDTVNVNDAYITCLIAGATAKALLRLLSFAEKDQVKLQALTIAYREYKSIYTSKLADFVGYLNKEAHPATVMGWDFLNDPGMLSH